MIEFYRWSAYYIQVHKAKLLTTGEWMLINSLKNLASQNIYVSSTNMGDYMKRAIELAKEALSAQEVPVGCVFVVDDCIVAESRNCVNETRNPTRHAEINCIDIIISSCNNKSVNYLDYFKKVDVYVTVEPCIMCAAALHKLQVRKVIYGCANDRFGGKTVLKVSKFYSYNYTLMANDVVADEAMSLLKTFYKGTNPSVPENKVKKKKKL